MKNNIQKYDSKNVLASIENFANQCTNSFNQKFKYTKSNKKFSNILILGMGGSALGGYTIDGLDIVNTPIKISHDYKIPSWVGSDTLVLAISYSGTTEETLKATDEAIKKGAHTVGITTGGALEKKLSKINMPIYKINTTENICGQPRFGVGSMMMAIIQILEKENLLNTKTKEIEKSLKEFSIWQNNFQKENRIKEIINISNKIKDKMPILVGSEHLANVMRFTRNQIHETGKVFAVAHDIPELNHHLMEGLSYPKENKNKLVFVFFESNLYQNKNKKRYEITKEVLNKQKIKYLSIDISGKNKFTQALISMQMSMYIAFTLSYLYSEDPSDIPWVNYFKSKL